MEECLPNPLSNPLGPQEDHFGLPEGSQLPPTGSKGIAPPMPWDRARSPKGQDGNEDLEHGGGTLLLPIFQSFESYPGPGCNFETLQMVVPHANFKVFKVCPSAQGLRENPVLFLGVK